MTTRFTLQHREKEVGRPIGLVLEDLHAGGVEVALLELDDAATDAADELRGVLLRPRDVPRKPLVLGRRDGDQAGHALCEVVDGDRLLATDERGHGGGLRLERGAERRQLLARHGGDGRAEVVQQVGCCLRWPICSLSQLCQGHLEG